MPATTYAVLCGADMDPFAIRAQPGLDAARFIAIGRTAALDIDGETWGIVLRVPADIGAGAPAIPVTLRDGAQVAAAPLTTAASAGDPAAILAQARYRGLPFSWRDRLARRMPGEARE